MTKPVIGVATLMMMEEGKVRLQDPISKFIPEWKNMTVAIALPAAPGARGAGPAPAPRPARRAAGAPRPDPRYYTVPVEREVQIRDILTHTSGVVSGTNSNFANRAVAAGPKDTLADYIPRLGKVPLEFQPGTRWAYSAAAGFDVLSRVVEVASGMPIDRFVKTAHLRSARDEGHHLHRCPTGNARLVKLYSRTADGLRPAQYPNFVNGIYFSGGGGLFSTAADYAQFAMMLANGGELNGKRLLSPRLVELMGSVFAPDTLPGRPKGESYGLSVRVVNDPVARNSFLTEGAFGWSGAYGTHFWVDRKEKLVVVVMTQTSNQEFLRDFENMVMQAVVSAGRSLNALRDPLHSHGVQSGDQHSSTDADHRHLHERDIGRPPHHIKHAQAHRQCGQHRGYPHRRGKAVDGVGEQDDRWRCEQEHIVPALRREQRDEHQQQAALERLGKRQASAAQEHRHCDAKGNDTCDQRQRRGQGPRPEPLHEGAGERHVVGIGEVRRRCPGDGGPPVPIERDGSLDAVERHWQQG